MHVMKLQNVGLRYNHTAEVLKDINLTIAEGDFMFLIGNSGAGKTTLLNLLNTSLKPSRGIVNILHHNIASVSAKKLAVLRQQIGFIFQDSQLIKELTVWQNIAIPLKIAKINTTEINNRVNQLLEWLNLAKYKDYYPMELSGGLQQQVAIARAIINNPKIILADEPTGSIDIGMGVKVMSLLKELNKNKVTILFATHNLNLINNQQHKVLEISNGKLNEYA